MLVCQRGAENSIAGVSERVIAVSVAVGTSIPELRKFFDKSIDKSSKQAYIIVEQLFNYWRFVYEKRCATMRLRGYPQGIGRADP